ncbi:hypothetical protein PFISCL1PPCAC_12897, partial [Pristionchus fissidentatus]
CWKPYSKLTNRAKNYRANAHIQIVSFALSMLTDTPQSEEDLKMRARGFFGDRMPTFEDSEVVQGILRDGAEYYKSATTKHERLWLLSLYSRTFEYHDMVEHIDGLSERTWNQAKKMGIDQGTYKETDNTKERYDPIKLEYFISFITSPYILIGLPYGHTKATDSQGTTYDLPQSIRPTGIYETIDMYIAYMKEMGLEKLLLKRTTCYKILSMLPLKKSHSLECVDYFQADATNNIFRLHVKKQSVNSDHCLTWTLSDPTNPHFSMPDSGHLHRQRCVYCKQIDQTNDDMKKML